MALRSGPGLKRVLGKSHHYGPPDPALLCLAAFLFLL